MVGGEPGGTWGQTERYTAGSREVTREQEEQGDRRNVIQVYFVGFTLRRDLKFPFSPGGDSQYDNQ
jgi:hypothetical protein